MEVNKCFFCNGRLYHDKGVWACYNCREVRGIDGEPGTFDITNLRRMSPGKAVRHYMHQKPRRLLAVGGGFVGLREDGTVLCANQTGEVSDALKKWKDIMSISASVLDVAGVKFDGTVVTTAPRSRWNVSGWRNIACVSVGSYHIVGLQYDGRVVAAGNNRLGQCEVSEWKDVVAIGANPFHTFGLTEDGRMLVTGGEQKESVKGLHRMDYHPNCKEAFRHISYWDRSVMDFECETEYAVCVSIDGSVKYSDIARKQYANDMSTRSFRQYGEIHRWTDVCKIAVSIWNIVGIRGDGTVVAAGKNADGRCDHAMETWTEIVDVCAGADGLLGLRADGTVVQSPPNFYPYALNEWNLFDSVVSLTRNYNRQFRQARETLEGEIEELRRDIPKLGRLNMVRKAAMRNRLAELEKQNKTMWG